MAQFVTCHVSAYIINPESSCFEKIEKVYNNWHSKCRKHSSYIWVALGGKSFGISPSTLLELTSLTEENQSKEPTKKILNKYKIINLRLQITHKCFTLWRSLSLFPRRPLSSNPLSFLQTMRAQINTMQNLNNLTE